MKISSKGADFIASFEKEILHVYDDGYGYPTAGIGHRVSLPIGTPVTKEQSRAWFASDLSKYGDAVNNGAKVHISQNQFDALTSLCFNIGIGAFGKSSLLKKLNHGDYAGCADGILVWNKSAGKKSNGLVRRRKAERATFLTPDAHTLISADPPAADARESVTESVTAIQPPPSSDDTNSAASPPTPPQYQGIGLMGVLKRDLAAIGGGNLSFQGLNEYATQASGWPPWVIGIISKAAIIAFVVGVIWIGYRVIHYIIWKFDMAHQRQVGAATNQTQQNTTIVQAAK